MKAAHQAQERIEAGSSTLRVKAKDGLVHIEATVKGSGAACGRTLLFPAMTPPVAYQLAQHVSNAALEAASPQQPGHNRPGTRRRFSAADVAEMRRLRAGGLKLKAIAERFLCTVSAVAYQTGGLIPPATNNAQRRPQNILDAIVRLYLDGMSARDIAARLQCSESGVRAAIRRYAADAPVVADPGPVHQLPLALRPQLVTED